MSSGTIKKLVLVAPSGSDQPNEGYGIILAENGREVFFLHSVVVDGRFEDLQRGQVVDFTIEDGPLGRAALVAPHEYDVRAAPTAQN